MTTRNIFFIKNKNKLKSMSFIIYLKLFSKHQKPRDMCTYVKQIFKSQKPARK